jgi:hypothetical protein
MAAVAVLGKKDYKGFMRGRQISGLFLVTAILLGSSACEFRKKKIPNVPQQAQAPAMVMQPPPMTTQPGPPPPATVEPSRPMPTPGEVAVRTPVEPAATKPKHVAKRPLPPKRTVVENTPPTVPVQPPVQPPPQQGQLTASVSHNEAVHQRVDTQQLIDQTEGTLRGLNRALSDDEQAMVAHIRSYIQQSKTATTDGDLERAYNLALKAHLLSDGLVKR